MSNVKDNTIRVLGAGIDTITGQPRNIALAASSGIVAGLEKTTVESKYSMGASKFYQSTEDLLFNFSSDIAVSNPQTIINANIDVAYLTARAKNAAYYVFEIYSIEYLDYLNKPSLSEEAALQLKNKEDLFPFFSSYGDAFIKSITYGKHIILVLRFDNISQENKTSFSAEVKASQSAGLGLKNILDKKFANVTCEAYLYTAGTTPQMPVLRTSEEIDIFLKGLPEQIKSASTAQIRWSYDTYHSIVNFTQEFQKINAPMNEIQRLIATVRYLKKALEKMKTNINFLLSSLQPSELDWDRSQQDNKYSLLNLSTDPETTKVETIYELLNKCDGVFGYRETLWYFNAKTKEKEKAKPIHEKFATALQNIISLLPVDKSQLATAEEIYLIAGATSRIYPHFTKSDLDLFFGISKLEKINNALEKIDLDIDNNVCDRPILTVCWAEIYKQNNLLKEFFGTLPAYFYLPIKVISGDLIRAVKHDKDKLTFLLPAPPEAIEIKLVYSEKKNFPIELKEFRQMMDWRHRIKYKKICVVKDIFSPLIFIPSPAKTSFFYLKHHKKMLLEESFQIKFYAKVKINMSSCLLPELSSEPDIRVGGSSIINLNSMSAITFFKSPKQIFKSPKQIQEDKILANNMKVIKRMKQGFI